MPDISEFYTYVENKDKSWTGIGLTEKAGKFQGVVYKYGKVNVKENEEKTEASLQFDWDVLDSNGLPKEMMDDDFFKLIGDILQDIIHKQMNEGELQYVNTDN
jgi:hypothetical protein|tara:strand:- start:675 stop:983 length:309 start_codon:yes stop_codon:yes gene_type:complete